MINSMGRVALLFAGVSLAGCTDLFNANFEHDTVGVAPVQSPEGGPIGDSILASAGPNFLVTSEMGIVGRKAFAFVGSEGGSGQLPRTVMRSALIESPDKPVEIMWHGTFGNGGVVTAMLGYLGKPYVQMEFADGDIAVEGKVLGTFHPGHHHQITVRLNPVEETYRISFTGDPIMAGKVVTGAARASKNEAGNQIAADFIISQSADEQLVYVIDEVRMRYVGP